MQTSFISKKIKFIGNGPPPFENGYEKLLKEPAKQLSVATMLLWKDDAGYQRKRNNTSVRKYSHL